LQAISNHQQLLFFYHLLLFDTTTMSAKTETTETTTETSSDPCGPVEDAVEEDDASLFEKIRAGNFTFKKFSDFDFDRFCHTGQVIDEVAVEGKRAIAEGADEFAAEHVPTLQSKSEVVQTKVKDGWSWSMATLATLPSKFSESWNEAAKTYHENKNMEDEEKSVQQSETSSAALAMR